MPVTKTPGSIAVIAPATLYWAPRNTVLPRSSLPVIIPPTSASAWPAPWVRVQDTMNGIALASRSPMDHLYSEERDEIAVVPAAGGGRRGGGGGGGGGGAGGSGAGVSISFEALTFTESFWNTFSYRSTASQAAQADAFSLTFQTACTLNGNYVINLGNTDGLTTTAMTVPLTSATQTTPTLVATAVRGATPPTGWTLGGTGAQVTFTSTATGPRALSTVNAGTTGVTVLPGDPTYTTVGTAAITSAYVNKNADFSVMIGFEGKLAAGAVTSQEQFVRGFAYRCLNTQNGQDVFRRTGADAFISPNLTLECLPEDFTQITTTQFAGTGYSASLADPFGKFNLFYYPSGA